MRKRIWTLLLTVLLVCQMALPMARAGEPKVYFMAAGESVLPLSDATMPFWSGGYLYIPSTLFTGNVWRSLGISYIRNNKGTVILHNASQAAGSSLLFERGKSYCKDSNGTVLQPGGVERGGIMFVPAFLVADFFGLAYSVTEVPRGHLVWLRKPNFGLSDKYFADAAAYNMESAYSAYRKAKTQGEQTPDLPPDAPPEVESNPGAGVYLCMEAGENTAGLLDELDRSRAAAAFFCTPDFLAKQGDLLRRITATGHTVGILADGSSDALPLLDQLEAGNQALEKATCTRTRLFLVRDGDEESLLDAESAGYLLLKPRLDRSGYRLNGSKGAASLMQGISSRRGSVSVWLGNQVTPAGLRHFLEASGKARDRCLALTETVA